MRQHFIVVGMAIISDSGEILIAQRPKDKALALKWEFPGGKLEQGESLESCIVREIREELGIDCLPDAYLGDETFEYDHAAVTMHLYTGKQWNPKEEPQALEHEALAWVRPESLSHFDFAAIDIPFLPKLCHLLIGGSRYG